MNLNLEKKYVQSAPENEDNRIWGYASLFDEVDQQGDQVARGAFLNSLQKRPVSEVKMLWQHDPAKPIGVWDSIDEDERGLLVSGHIITEIEAGREALALLRAGAVNGLSIGYRTLVSGKSEKTGRILKSLDLWEISLVTFPMLAGARAQIEKENTPPSAMRELELAAASLKNLLIKE